MAEDELNINRYSVEATTWEDEPVLRLTDHASGSYAVLAPGLGANCVEWVVSWQQQELDVIESPDSPQVLRDRASKMGVPVLFPFPGRVRAARYRFNGQEYSLPHNERTADNHIHGGVLNIAWETMDYGVDETGAYALLRVGPEDLHDEFLKGYPFRFNLSLKLSLRERHLEYLITVENRDTQPIPVGFGLHPYFITPLLPTGTAPDRSKCPVRLPVSGRWPTEGGLPTGPLQPSPAGKDFSNWQELGEAHFDDMFGGVIQESGWSWAAYRNPGLGLEVVVAADRDYQNWVLYTPPERPSIAIEPYTCPPNGINFSKEGLLGDNLIILGQGETWQSKIYFEVR